MTLDNPIIIYLILGVIFLAILAIMLGINQSVKSIQRNRKMVENIRGNRDAWAPVQAEADDIPTTFSGKLLKMIGAIGVKFSSDNSGSYSGLRLRLFRAGIRSPNAPQIFWGAKIWSPIILVLTFAFTRSIVPQLRLLSIPVVVSTFIAVGLLGFYLPELWLSVKAHFRKVKITQDLPDALDLLVVCVEAGLGLDSAFNRVADEIKMTCPELGGEFKLLNLELRAGKPRQDALRNLAARADIDSLKSLVTLMIQTEMFGTGITKALRVFSDSFRTKRFQKAEEIAAKLPVKMLLPMVCFIFPMFMAVMVGPACINIWDNWLNK
jgi:tight adherence protein C